MMQALDRNAFLLSVLGLVVVYVFAAMLTALAWVLYRALTGRRVFPASPLVDRRPVPWGVWTVLLMVAMYLVVPNLIVVGYLMANGIPLKGRPNLSLVENLTIQAVASVVMLFLAVLVLRLTSRSPLRDLGLSMNRWWLQIAVGLVAYLAMEPVLRVTQFAMTKIWESQQHPVLKMVMDEFSPGVPQLAILLAVVVAPIWEELVFRGVIQSWLVSRYEPLSLAPESLQASSAAIGEEVDVPMTTPPAEAGALEFGAELASDEPSQPKPAPAAKDSAVISRKRAAIAGITMTSLIFAALHFEQWPAPIALFLLSVAMGYVYERTGSLMAAICMHASFNGLSTFFLLTSLLAPQSPQIPKAEKAGQPAAIIDISNAGDDACIRVGKGGTSRGFL